MTQTNRIGWINADWPAPHWIKAGTTTRRSGFSSAPYKGLNLAQHVGDKMETVELNRELLQSQRHLPSSPLWLQQEHGNRVINSEQYSANIKADACYTSQRKIVCAVLSADCLPLLLCDKKAGHIAAIHLGWRGICSSLVNDVLAQFKTRPEDILAWIGPHIHAHNYEVGEEVREACLQACPGTDHAFSFVGDGFWQASLDALVRHQLVKRGISMIYACDNCTYDDQRNFYSYRRQKETGRMASLIWMECEKK